MEFSSIREQRIRKITNVYYSNPKIQEAIFNFSSNREICPRYFEGFGKRPDSFQYPGDIFELVKKGATSFNCSEEIWEDPLKIKTGMDEDKLNELRIGWDLVLDIDSKYIDYSKIYAKIIINFLEFSGVKNIGIKFSGSKGFHIIVPWKSFPKEINGVKTSDMFPEWPKIITKYIMEKTKTNLVMEIGELQNKEKYGSISKYLKGESRDKSFADDVMPDLILISPRHLFRMPYSLHEKTSLASVVIDKNKVMDFQLKDADPLKAEIKEFIPECTEGEATQLLMQALDWSRENNLPEEKKNFEFKPVKITDHSEKNFPPCIKKILQGIKDGKKRALFALINFFRFIGMDKDEFENIIYSWNEKNEPKIKEGYIKSQISWSLRKKPIMPPNCREFYQGIGVCAPDNLCSMIKNPVGYVIRKNFQLNKTKPKNKDNFKKTN